MIYNVHIRDQTSRVELEGANGVYCRLDGRHIETDAVLVRPGVLSLRVGNKSYEVRRESLAGGFKIWVGHQCVDAEIRDPRSLRERARAADQHGVRKLTAPMPGKVVRVLVEEGAQVEAGEGVIVVEAMKMQNEVKSPKKGKVQKILVNQGTAVNAGDLLAIIE